MARARFWVVGCLVLLSCSGDDEGGGPCVGGDERCGATCSEDNRPCPVGLYCSEAGQCAKECDLDNPCAGGGMCRPNGTCTGGRDGGTSSGASGTGPGGGLRPGACADTVVDTSRTTPTVILIVDQSSSMEEEFDDGSRWDVLRDFLLEEPNGLISDLQSQVRFGLAMYSAESGGTAPDPIGECPMVTSVAPAIDNYGAIADVYRDAEPIEDTPTGDAIDRIVDDLPLNPESAPDPVVFVLATDGEPDRCEELDPQNGQAEAIAAVERAYTQGIRTFIISVGEGEISAEHQQDVANAGLGREPGDADAEYWVAGDDQTLRDALTSIVGGQLGCEIALNGRVEGDDACLGRVLLNDVELECDGDDGWELVDPQHIRLLGTACDQLKSGDDVYLDVSFPCDVVSVD
jgi:hypothetical protein